MLFPLKNHVSPTPLLLANLCIFQDTAHIASLHWSFHWLCKLVRHSLIIAVFENDHRILWHPTLWDLGSVSLLLASGWACSCFIQCSKWRSDTSVFWGYQKGRRGYLLRLSKRRFLPLFAPGRHALEAWGCHAVRKPGSMERPCVCTLVTYPSHCIFPHGNPEVVGHSKPPLLHLFCALSKFLSHQICENSRMVALCH